MQPATIGTAGPAGHGKSALVRALAGEPAPDATAASEATVDLGFGFHDIHDVEAHRHQRLVTTQIGSPVIE